MAKVYPQLPTTTTTSSTSTSTATTSSSGKETYTIWTKSLICHGNGCTVFDSRGGVAYRVDNYGVKKSRQVYLMDLHGNVLFSLLKPHKLLSFGTNSSAGCWNGYKGTPNDHNIVDYVGTNFKEMPWFQVRKNSKSQGKSKSKRSSCQVIMGSDHESRETGYRIDKGTDKAGFEVTDSHGNLVAQVKHKESSCGGGVLLGDDVLSLVVEPHEHDHSLVMALVLVYGLMTNIIM